MAFQHLSLRKHARDERSAVPRPIEEAMVSKFCRILVVLPSRRGQRDSKTALRAVVSKIVRELSGHVIRILSYFGHAPISEGGATPSPLKEHGSVNELGECVLSA